MRIVTLSALVLFTSIFAVAQEAPRVTDDEWIVIFVVKRDIPTDPYFEVRCIVRAANEGEAALNSSRALSRIVSTSAYEGLKFIEAQPRKGK